MIMRVEFDGEEITVQGITEKLAEIEKEMGL